MTDLELLRSTPTPRPREVCRRFRLDSIWGFVLYGALWFFVSCLFATAGLFAALAVVDTPPTPLGKVVVMGAWGSGFVLAWVLFAMWVRRRLAPAAVLFRDGSFGDARVEAVHHLSIRGAPFTRATLRIDGATGRPTIGLSMGGHPPELREGAVVPVLWVPGHRYCATFPLGGRLVAASLSSPSS